MTKWKDMVKGALFTDDGPPKGSPSDKPTVPAPSASAPALRTHAPVSAQTVVVLADKTLVDKLRGSVNDATDQVYREFLQTFAALGSTIPDVRQRFVSAFTVVAMKGLTGTAIKAAIKARFDALEIQRKKFAEGLETLRSQKIGGREQELRDLDGEIAKRRSQIKSLEAEIDSISSRQGGIRTSIESDRADIDMRGMKAQAAIQAVEAELTIEQRNAEAHLPGGNK